VVALKTNNHKPIIIMEIDDWGEVMAFALKGGYGSR